MGGGDLNLKKSWHPGTLKNIEKVYLKEKSADEEKKKTAQLQKELEEQRAMQELQKLNEASGTVKKRQERLDWMYAGPGSQSQLAEDREAYLLGKKRVDKLVEQGKSVDELSAKNSFAVTSTSIYGTEANTSRDLQNKIREDPLLAIKRKEQASLAAVLNNPLRVKAIKEAKEAKKKDKKDKKEKKKDKKRKRHDGSSDEEAANGKAGAEDEWTEKKVAGYTSPPSSGNEVVRDRGKGEEASKRRRSRSRSVERHGRRERSPPPSSYRRERSRSGDRQKSRRDRSRSVERHSSRRDRSRSAERNVRRNRSRSNDRNNRSAGPRSEERRKSRSRSRERKRSPVAASRDRPRDDRRNDDRATQRRRSRSRSPPRHSSNQSRDRPLDSHRAPARRRSTSPAAATAPKKVDDERLRKLEAMKANAANMDADRLKRLEVAKQRDAEEDAKEALAKKRRMHDGDDEGEAEIFRVELHQRMLGGGREGKELDVAEMVKRNRATVDRGSKVIVMFKAGTPADKIEAAVKEIEAAGGSVGHRYSATILGFAATIPDNVLTSFQANDLIETIEADGEVSIYAKEKGL
ncbi:RNA-splicing factor [Phlyctochytrium planicorne]|nr:RNA-splicing factor [Phlyctochytrium planicorne]